MHTVTKGTKKATEYVELKSRMDQLALAVFEQHKKAVEEWKHGEIAKVWFDHAYNLCVEYEDGEYWHYNEKGEWW